MTMKATKQVRDRVPSKATRAVLWPLAALPVLALALAGCGGSDGGSDSGPTGPSSAKPGTTTPTVEVVASGFGQRDAYVQGIAIVTSADKAAVGEFATVSMNFLDETGATLGTEEQTEQFSWVNQQLVLPVWLDLSSTDPKAKVAKIEVSATLSDNGSSASSRPELASVETTTIGDDADGSTTATFELTNSGSEDLKDLRVGVVCYDADQAIIGGTSEYPDLVAAGKTVRIDADVVTSGTPASCTAYPNYGD